MKLNEIDMTAWERSSHFSHFMKGTRCVITVTAETDITGLPEYVKRGALKFYPVFTYIISKTINGRREFKLSAGAGGAPGYYDRVDPSYIIFHRETETVTQTWTEYNRDFTVFYENMNRRTACLENFRGFSSEPLPPNIFNVSCLPWLVYSSLDLHVFDEAAYLAPVITWGRFHKKDKQTVIPLTMQIHHAAADGFHIARFFRETEENVRQFINNSGNGL